MASQAVIFTNGRRPESFRINWSTHSQRSTKVASVALSERVSIPTVLQLVRRSRRRADWNGRDDVEDSPAQKVLFRGSVQGRWPLSFRPRCFSTITRKYFDSQLESLIGGDGEGILECGMRLSLSRAPSAPLPCRTCLVGQIRRSFRHAVVTIQFVDFSSREQYTPAHFGSVLTSRLRLLA